MDVLHNCPLPSFVALALSSCLVAAPAWAEPVRSCAEEVAIDAAEEDSLQLRQALSDGMLHEAPASSCEGVTLRLERLGETMRVVVERGGQVTSRDVASVERAAMWVEAWLLPPDESPIDSPPPQSGAEVDPDGTPEEQASSEPETERHHVETRLQMLVSPSFDGDSSIWLGPEVSVAALLRRAFWLGGGIGMSFWVWPNPTGERFPADIPTVRFAIRLGGRLDLSDRLNLDLGAGVGFILEPHPQMDEKIIPFGEVVGELEVVIWRSISFNVGVLARINMRYLDTRDAVNTAAYTEHPDQVVEPPIASIAAGEIRAGFSYTFGR